MKEKTKFVAFSTQKGGAGKTTLTVLAASYLHNIPVDPLLQRGNAPHLRVVEHGVEPPDTLAEGYEQRFIGDFLVYFIRFHILAFYGRLLPPRNFLIR